MTIMDNAQATLARLNRIREAQVGVNEAKALEVLRGELLQLSGPINLLASKAKLLINKGVVITSVTDIGPIIETIKKVSSRFVEMPKSITLRQGKRWTGLSRKLEELAKKSGEIQADDWRNFFVNNFFGGLPPNQREAKLAPTPENKHALERYKVLYQSFVKYRSNIPKDTEDFKTLRLLSEQLAQIKFQEDVPENVRKFFEATNTGASLDLLTIEVIEWLRSNNLLSSYIVRAKL